MRAEACVPKESVISPRTGGMTAPPETPTMSKAETSLAFSGIRFRESENIIEKRFA